MKNPKYLLMELFLFFVILPVILALPLYHYWVKGIFVLAGFAYIVYILIKETGIKFRVKRDMNWRAFWKTTGIKFGIVAVVTGIFVFFTKPEALFFVPLNKPGLYIMILFIYTFLSVWPQELIYRTFFFKRYEHLFKNRWLFVLVNGMLFSLAHIFFRNTLVMVLTFIGGILFALTYFKFRSTTLVSIEHALYGNWLFTVGMGEMLAFPGMEVS